MRWYKPSFGLEFLFCLPGTSIPQPGRQKDRRRKLKKLTSRLPGANLPRHPAKASGAVAPLLTSPPRPPDRHMCQTVKATSGPPDSSSTAKSTQRRKVRRGEVLDQLIPTLPYASSVLCPKVCDNRLPHAPCHAAHKVCTPCATKSLGRFASKYFIHIHITHLKSLYPCSGLLHVPIYPASVLNRNTCVDQK